MEWDRSLLASNDNFLPYTLKFWNTGTQNVSILENYNLHWYLWDLQLSFPHMKTLVFTPITVDYN